MYKRVDLIERAKPVIFNTDDVCAIITGRKTVMRQVVKPQPPKDAVGYFERCDDGSYAMKLANYDNIYDYNVMPLYMVGDILYVREAWSNDTFKYLIPRYAYKADYTEKMQQYCGLKWRSPVNMPKQAVRLFLRITDVHIERIQSISDIDMVRDFCRCTEAVTPQLKASLAEACWNESLNKKNLTQYAWSKNPYVFVYEFEKL